MHGIHVSLQLVMSEWRGSSTELMFSKPVTSEWQGSSKMFTGMPAAGGKAAAAGLHNEVSRLHAAGSVSGEAAVAVYK